MPFEDCFPNGWRKANADAFELAERAAGHTTPREAPAALAAGIRTLFAEEEEQARADFENGLTQAPRGNKGKPPPPTKSYWDGRKWVRGKDDPREARVTSLITPYGFVARHTKPISDALRSGYNSEFRKAVQNAEASARRKEEAEEKVQSFVNETIDACPHVVAALLDADDGGGGRVTQLREAGLAMGRTSAREYDTHREARTEGRPPASNTLIYATRERGGHEATGPAPPAAPAPAAAAPGAPPPPPPPAPPPAPPLPPATHVETRLDCALVAIKAQAASEGHPPDADKTVPWNGLSATQKAVITTGLVHAARGPKLYELFNTNQFSGYTEAELETIRARLETIVANTAQLSGDNCSMLFVPLAAWDWYLNLTEFGNSTKRRHVLSHRQRLYKYAHCVAFCAPTADGYDKAAKGLSYDLVAALLTHHIG